MGLVFIAWFMRKMNYVEGLCTGTDPTCSSSSSNSFKTCPQRGGVCKWA